VTALVAGVDSSTQSCKVVIRDAATGALVREGRAAHPDSTEVDPAAWRDAGPGTAAVREADPQPAIRARYAEARDRAGSLPAGTGEAP
jgi:sugar (pentulose or hexulose) kinase